MTCAVPLAPLGELVAHHALQNVGARLEPEHLVGEVDRARLLGVERGNVGLHYSWLPPSCAPASAVACSGWAFLSLRRIAGGLAEGARLRRGLGQRPLHRVAQQHPAAFGARHGAADHDQPALGVGLDHAQILRGDVDIAHMPGHLLALEHLAGVLALAGRAVAAMAHRHAVARAQAAEVVTLHGAGEALADRGARHIDELPSTKWSAVISAPTSIRLSGLTRNSTSFRFGSTLATAKCPRAARRQTLHLGPAGAELQRGIAVLLRGAVADHLTMVELQHRHRDVLPGIGEDPGHADLLRDDT